MAIEKSQFFTLLIYTSGVDLSVSMQPSSSNLLVFPYLGGDTKGWKFINSLAGFYDTTSRFCRC